MRFRGLALRKQTRKTKSIPTPPSSTTRSLAQKLKTETNEALSTLRQVALMPTDMGRFLPTTRQEDHVVVLVHGFFASAGVFRPLRQKIERELSAKTASFTYLPGAGLQAIACRLAKLVDEIPIGPSIHIVGHSLGGLAARWYVQELGGYSRIAQTISLGSPFAGTRIADPFPFLVGRDLGTESEVLARLRDKAPGHPVPHISIVGQADRMVIPQHSASLPSGDVAMFEDLGHNAMLYDARVHDLIAQRILTWEKMPKRSTDDDR